MRGEEVGVIQADDLRKQKKNFVCLYFLPRYN